MREYGVVWSSLTPKVSTLGDNPPDEVRRSYRSTTCHNVLVRRRASIEEVTMPGYKWVRWPVPYTDSHMMISIGRDLDGSNLVVGRAMHQGDMIPAKVKPEHGVAYVSHGGAEHAKHHFEVLMPTPPVFNWIHSSHGHVPDHAVEAGRTSNGEMLYVGRAYHNGVPCVGKVHRSHGCLYVPYDGKEISYSSYEVLVQI